MTLDEAIKHCKEVAHEKRIESGECISVNDLENAEACYECGEDHKQLAEWLTELKTLRKNRWISCSERLPELDTMVIVCYYGSDCIFPMQGETVTEAIARQNKVPTVTMGFLSEEGWCGSDMFPMMVRPTFWMNLPDAPLPEPPEKE